MRFENKDRWDWHKWFAWYPIETECGRWVWLETVDRKFNVYWFYWNGPKKYTYHIPE